MPPTSTPLAPDMTDDDPDRLPWVTLVTPAYNQGEYLAETIDSVLAQDYPKLEYIVLDDGSTDDTPAVLARYTGKIRHQRHANMGQARTLNRGWAMGKGSLIGYLSSDDLLEPRAISQLVEALRLDPSAVVSYGDFKLIDAIGRVFREVQAEDYSADRLCVDLVCQPGPGALIRRTVFDATGGWDGDLRQVPDFEFWLRASRFGHFIRVNSSLARYRIHDDSASLRPINRDRSMEIVGVASRFWAGHEGRHPKRALAKAHLIAARSHAQSGRYLSAFGQAARAIIKHPSELLRPASWRTFMSGFLRRLSYSIQIATRH